MFLIVSLTNIKGEVMLQNFLVSFLIIIMSSMTLFAQDRMVMRPDGKFYRFKGNENSFEVMKIKPNSDQQRVNPTIRNPLSVNDVIDTLGYNDGSFNTNFGFFGQDWMLQWFVAPADLIIKGFADWITDNLPPFLPPILEGKIVSIKLNEEQLISAPVEWEGYYPASGNGYNDITAFLDNPDRTGEWISKSGDPEPFDTDIWSDGGVGFLIQPTGMGGYQWIRTNEFFEPTVLLHERFGIAFRNTGVTMNADRVGFLAGIIGAPGWKFYANGRFNPGVDFGWWSREYTWDYLVEVEFIGDIPPEIHSFTTVRSGTSKGPFSIDAVITDENPIGPAGIAQAILWWSNDDGTSWNDDLMTGTEPNFTGEIPVQAINTEVLYYIEAEDIGGMSTISESKNFFIFNPSGASTLVIFNGFDKVNGYPQDYYFGPDIFNLNLYFDHDVWAYGPISEDVYQYYQNIFEITQGEPEYYTDVEIRHWLEENGSRNYFLAGDDWLIFRSGYPDENYYPGLFEYDILGLLHLYNDVSYDGTSGYNIPSLLFPQQSSLFGQSMFDLFNSYLPPPDSLMYNPNYILLSLNKIDGFEILEDAVTDMMVETRAIGGIHSVELKPTGTHRTLPAGNKIIFLGYNPLALTTAIDSTYPYYNWSGFDSSNVCYQALKWFRIDIVTNVNEQQGIVPGEFSLVQNYPNPFNPSTKISWQTPAGSWQTLKIYDVLGNEVATLVDEYKPSGRYEVEFDGHSGEGQNLSSGVYFYQLKAGSFIQTRKMILIK